VSANRAVVVIGAVLLIVHGGRFEGRRLERASIPPHVAWQVVDLEKGQVIGAARADILRTALAPGSIIKIATAVSALESGVITPETSIGCTGVLTIDRRRLACQHPRLSRPLGAADALQHSCNVFFATIGQRLPRARLDGTLAALGLPATPIRSPMALAASGIEATAVAPTALLVALTRLFADPPAPSMSASTRRVLLDGLRRAAESGTASAFGAHHVDAYAKTGTADGSRGGVHGLVVAAWPAPRPTRAAVVVAPGGAGSDAAEIAARLASGDLDHGSGSSAAPTLRVGIAAADGRINVKTLDLDGYVAQVLAGEAVAKSAPAALEALAIAVRTFALANRGRHERDGYDLCALTHCQVVRPPYDAARAAAETTTGLILAWQGQPARIFYTASCGGRTEIPSAVWIGAADPPYLPSQRDAACGGEPHWDADIDARSLIRALKANGFAGDTLRDVRIATRTASRRVGRLRLAGLSPDGISGQDFRMAVGRALGWHLIKSTDFEITRVGRGYRFSGRGFGHGVGMCVIGAAQRASAGESAREILAKYYPGLDIRTLPQVSLPTAAAPTLSGAIASGEGTSLSLPHAGPAPASPARPRAGAPASRTIDVVLPDADAGRRAGVLDLTRQASDAISRATGRTLPTGVRLVFHPTVQSFSRATGEPWWTSAISTGSRVDLVPIEILEQRGSLALVVRHELAHLATADLLTGRPEWVKEGVAMYFAGERPPQTLLDSGRPLKCPSDDQLRRPASAGVARDAYARAAACVIRAIARGKRWDEID
jgi:SpoIID/LytB domain protein